MSAAQALPPKTQRAAAECPSALIPGRLLTPEEAAAKLNLSPKTLAKDRCTRQMGIPFVKFLRSVRYRDGDLDKFIADRVVA